MSNIPSLHPSPPAHPAILYVVAGVLIIAAALCGYALGESWPLWR